MLRAGETERNREDPTELARVGVGGGVLDVPGLMRAWRHLPLGRRGGGLARMMISSRFCDDD